MMIDTDYQIRIATRKEVDIAIEWATIEGWNPGLHDANCFYSADPNGFLIGFLGNEPIATISAIQYGNTFGFIGFYIVKPEYRNQGYGIQIWNAALRYLQGRNIGLDGVVAQQDNYKKSNFKLAYRNIRYQGVGGGLSPDTDQIVNLAALPFEMIESYERPLFPEVRTSFIKAWITQPESNALGIMSGGRLAGYGVIRRCHSGYKIGPLYADTPELAESLYLALTSGVSTNESIFLDVPELNRAAVSLAERQNMNVVFETARMYTGEEPVMPLERIFGVTSFEVG